MITLKKLTLKNFAVVSSTEINFDRGMTVITGETGAGKSLVVGAIGLLLGERGKSEYVRAGSDHAIIEGVFKGDLEELSDLVAEEDLSISGDELTLTREIFSDGRNRCLLNDQRVNLNTLKKIGERICDLHGQHQHQWLLDPNRHLWFLDRFGNCDQLFEAYSAFFSEYRRINNRLLTMECELAESKEKREFWQFQLEEINSVNPLPGEEELLEDERKKLENIVRIKEALQSASLRLDSEGAARSLVADSIRHLSSIEALFPEVEPFLKELETLKISLLENARSLEEKLDRLYEDPQRLELIGERQSRLYELKRKHGGSIDEVLKTRERLSADLGAGDTLELEIAELKKQLSPTKLALRDAALKLQKGREAAAVKLRRAMSRELGSLGLPKAEMVVEFRSNESGELVDEMKLSEHGSQSGQFLFNANLGEELKPLDKVASGGEISRVMLALKSLISGNDRVELLVFDEIDSGIGGETALLVGKKLKELSDRQQLIVITHLQQIASYSDHHLKAVKIEKGKRTESELISLNKKERIVEIGRMISGGSFGEEERRQAEKLLKEASAKVSFDN